ncbi:MAG: response regulator transcription factor [Muribaculaceae bacterium]
MEKRVNILVVDDEETICEVLKINLELEGYNVDCAHSAEEASKLQLLNYSLILLDVMMGEMNGFEFASLIRKEPLTANIPIIICTAKDSDTDLIEGFNRGVDDYIKKPFLMRELVLRVKSVLRRSDKNTNSDIITYKTLQIDIIKKKCIIDGEDIQLTKKEFEMLQLFLGTREKIFSREEILDRVWESDVLVIDRTIDVNINRLRKKIKNYGTNIITKLGYGYGFKE